MRIACVAYLHGFGGAERQITTLANQMVDRGHEVHFILLAEDKRCYEIDPRILIHNLTYVERGSAISRILSRRKALIKTLRNLHCDVVVNFNFQSAYLLAYTSKKKIGKVLYSERGDPGDKEYGGLLGLVRRLSLHHINGYVFQSEGARDYFRDKYVQSHCTVIPNACFQKRENPYDGVRDKRIVNVGRLSKQKNQKVLLEAFARVSEKYSDFILEIYGEGELKDELQVHSETLNVSKSVHFMGTTPNVGERIKSASLFVLSSDYEGIPNALIEAMAKGLPCISTDCKPGGARTLIQEGVNGMITPINDSAALASAIEYMLSHPDEANRLASNACKIAERLSPATIYDKWERFLMHTLKN